MEQTAEAERKTDDWEAEGTGGRGEFEELRITFRSSRTRDAFAYTRSEPEWHYRRAARKGESEIRGSSLICRLD